MSNVVSTNQRDVWLVKVPKYMASGWKNATPGTDLGKLQVPKDPKGRMKFILDPKLQKDSSTNGNGNLPSEHILTLHPLYQQSMVILAQNKDATNTSQQSGDVGEMTFEGDVKQRGEMRPTGDMSYMNLKTSLIRQAAKPTKVTQILEKAVTSYKPRGATQMAHEADLRKRKEEARKTIKEDKEIVQGRLFAAFEKTQYYKINDLARITNQALPYLKEILKEICNHCSKGTYKNMWELKPEYRHYKASSSSQSSK